MKKIFIFSLLSFSYICTCNAATTPWWLQPTICKLSSTNCYAAMGAGFDSELWDPTSSCWGQKLICGHALKNGGTDAVPMKRIDIANKVNIKDDFDVDMLSYEDECFGRRKTSDGGATTIVNGNPVKVWCTGILDDVDEVLANGEISHDKQPTCASLALDGYVGVKNNRCYGKYFSPDQYYIECGTSSLLPTRLVILNNADYTAPMNGAPATKEAAEKIFEDMYKISKIQKQKYFQD